MVCKACVLFINTSGINYVMVDCFVVSISLLYYKHFIHVKETTWPLSYAITSQGKYEARISSRIYSTVLRERLRYQKEPLNRHSFLFVFAATCGFADRKITAVPSAAAKCEQRASLYRQLTALDKCLLR